MTEVMEHETSKKGHIGIYGRIKWQGISNKHNAKTATVLKGIGREL